jgi:hypothetical protein
VQDAHLGCKVANLRPQGAESLGHFAPEARTLLGHFAPEARTLLGHFAPEARTLLGHLPPETRTLLGHFAPEGHTLLGHLAPHSRKLNTHLRAKLRNLRCEVVDPGWQLFECGHAALETFDSGFNRLRRHRSISFSSPFASDGRRTVRSLANTMPACRDDATIVRLAAQPDNEIACERVPNGSNMFRLIITGRPPEALRDRLSAASIVLPASAMGPDGAVFVLQVHECWNRITGARLAAEFKRAMAG